MPSVLSNYDFAWTLLGLCSEFVRTNPNKVQINCNYKECESLVYSYFRYQKTQEGVSKVKHYRHCERAKQSVDSKNKDCFVILPRNDVFS